LNLIANQDVKELRKITSGSNKLNLNFLVEDSDIQFDQKISPLLCACYIGKIEIVQIILENESVDVNLESYPESYTPLMVGCFKGFYEIARILLEKKANVNKSNRMGQLPLLFCFSRLEENFFRYENKKICMMLIELLLNKGANLNIRIDEKFGYTILMKLASTEFTNKEKFQNTMEMVKFLIERGADPNLKSFNHKSIYDVINPETIPEFKEELIATLRTNYQIFFYGENEFHDGKSNSASKQNTLKDDYSKILVIENNLIRTNCCIICKSHFYLD
jgi:ankyrin repeat protein